MIEPLIAFCGLRCLVVGQHVGKFRGQGVGVYHLSFGIARMYADTLDADLRTGSIEVLELQFANIPAIHRVGPFAAELLYIKMVGAHADLFVGIKGNTDITVTDLLMVAQIAHGLYNLCDSSFVIGSQQRVAVGDDQVLADMM